MSHRPGPASDPTSLKLAAARLWATHHYPYLASAIFASPYLPAPDLGRLVIDRWWRIHADPAVVESSTVAELGGELLHLASHVLRAHAERADEVALTEQAELHHWVDAADAEVNDDFPPDIDRVSPSVDPSDLLCDQGRLAEEYYRRGAVREGETNDCGSGAHGRSPSWEPPPPASRSDPGVDPDDQRLIRRRVAADIANSPADGVGPGLRTWAEHHLGGRVDWRAELAATVRHSVYSVSGAVDYTYRRPSRRASAVSGVVMPSLVRPSVEVVVICDTSASVSDDQLGLAVNEVDGLLRAIGTRSITVLACDTAVAAVSRVTTTRGLTLTGGGGTDMAAGIEAAMARRPRPDVVVTITDGFTPWPPSAPGAEVVVALLETDGPIEPDPPPSWARTVPVPA
jgi:hypothetical protein